MSRHRNRLASQGSTINKIVGISNSPQETLLQLDMTGETSLQGTSISRFHHVCNL